jgi:hypothetical protein
VTSLLLTCGTCCDSFFYLSLRIVFFPSLSTYLIRLLIPAHCSSSMFSLLSSTFVVSKVGTPRPTLSCFPTTWRFFSQSHTRYAEPEDPVARRKRLAQNERRRYRYHNDPVYRERQNTRRMITNPLYRDQEKRRMRLRYEDWRDLNPTAYAEQIEKHDDYITQRRASDPRFKLSHLLDNFLLRNAWAGKELPWKTHVPTVYPEKVTKQCACCDRQSSGGGLRLWYVCRVSNL